MDKLEQISFKDKKAIFDCLEKMASQANLTPEERAQYETEWKIYNDYFNTIESAKKKGYIDGIKEGRLEGLQEARKEGHEKGHKEGLTEGIAEGFFVSINNSSRINKKIIHLLLETVKFG